MQLFSKYVINKIVYAKQPKAKHQKRLDSAEDYEILNCSYVDAPVMVPPSNSSGETMAELETIAAAEALHKNPGKLEHKYDDEFDWAFKKVVEEAGLEYDEVYFKKLIKEAASITIRLKYKFNRPRPFQLSEYYNIKLGGTTLESMKTPSYPSGHSTQGILIGKVLQTKLPINTDAFLEAGKRISYSRNIGRAHYPSDSRLGEEIGTEMYRYIIHKI